VESRAGGRDRGGLAGTIQLQKQILLPARVTAIAHENDRTRTHGNARKHRNDDADGGDCHTDCAREQIDCEERARQCGGNEGQTGSRCFDVAA
jgi:hypothetical protein